MSDREAGATPGASNEKLAADGFNRGQDQRVTVFDDVERIDPSEANHGESVFEFLNRVRSPFWEDVRSLIESWVAGLPEDVAPDIQARLRTRDDRHFHGAFWELYLHQTLTASGCTLTHHPEVPGTDRRPDFLVEGEGNGFYLEARVVSDSDEAVTAGRRLERIYDSLNRHME